MSNGFDKLKDIGAQKIHEKTHITREHVQAILHDSFEGMNKIQFLGFISILEREYNVKLNELKMKGLEYFLNITSEVDKDDNLFAETGNKNNKNIYIVLISLVVIIVAFFILNKTFFNHAQQNVQNIDDTNIEKIKDNILKETESVTDTNSSTVDQDILEVDKSSSQEDVNIAIENKTEQIEPKAAGKKYLKIMPNVKLWIGYTDLEQNKTYQKLFSDELSLDGEKVWLLSLGHGNVNFDINGKIIEYNSKKNIKFLYKDNNLTEITISKFNTIKKDNKW
jgi:hypothetical protein